MPNSTQNHAVFIFPGMGDDGLYAIRLATILTKYQSKKHRTDFYCFPFGWKVNRTPELVEKRYQQLTEELELLRKKYSTISLMGISTGSALALKYVLDNPENITSVVGFCGCIKYDQEYLDLIRHKGFKNVVKEIDTKLQKETQEIKKLKEMLLTVTTKKDEIVPHKLQIVEGVKEYKMQYLSHLLASTIGVIENVTQKEKSPVWKWLVNGPKH